MTKIATKSEITPENKPKDKYRILNWKDYNKSLVRRGDITIWIEEGAVEHWYHKGPDQQGAQYVYSDECIECLLGLKAVFSLAYRQTEGFAGSILKLMGYDLKVPSYSQISRRAGDP